MCTSHPTPVYSHLKSPQYRDVYEPAEDTFLFMDALEKDVKFICRLRPTICLEIGPGSGAVLAFLAKLLSAPSFLWAVDINLAACHCTKQTLLANECSPFSDVVTMDLVSCFQHKLKGKVDILLFNPPYVVTPSEEVGGRGIEASWAGGINGREVTDRVLHYVPQLLAPHGAFYLVVIRENKPDEICDVLSQHGLSNETVLSRRARNESLSVIKFYRSRTNTFSS